VTAIAYATNMTVTRRGLLQAGGAAVLAVAVAEVGQVGTALSNVGAPAHLRRSSYVPLIGDRFELNAETGRILARLVAVKDPGFGKPIRGATAREDVFALVFHDPGSARLEQDVMTLRHPALGQFRLLVSPASNGRRGQHYAAVINRARPPRR
jgi:hypothetical protein